MAEERRVTYYFESYLVPLIFIIALVVLGIYAYAWLSSESGQTQWVQAKAAFGKYNPVTLITGQIWETQRAVTWTGESNATAKKQGIQLNSFSAISTKALAGGDILLKYGIDTNIPSTYTIPTDFYCKISSTEAEGETIPPNPVTITSTKTPSVRCKFSEEQTKTLSGPVKIDGWLTFPYTTKDVKLPVYLARETAAENFFDKYGINERQPIKVQYNEEPVELAIGVSDENTQPVIVAEESYPMIGIAIHNRWGGKIKAITGFEMTLPEGITVNQQITKNPTTICPFELSTTTKAGDNVYKAPASMLTELETSNLETFECWLNIEQDIIPQDSDYIKKSYAASISYIYQTNPKTGVVTVGEGPAA